MEHLLDCPPARIIFRGNSFLLPIEATKWMMNLDVGLLMLLFELGYGRRRTGLSTV